MSKQYPTTFESARGAIVAFLKSCDPHMEKLRDRELLREEINRFRGGGALGNGVKATGIKRPTDLLGRVVLPRELRRHYGIEPGDAMEIFYDDVAQFIVLKKYEPNQCAVCGSNTDLTPIKGKHVCEDCISRIV